MESPKGKSGITNHYHGAYAVASGFAAFVPYHHEEEAEVEPCSKADSPATSGGLGGLSAPGAGWQEAG